MRRLLLLSLAAALALPPSAPAAQSPELVVTPASNALGRVASTDIELSFPAGAPATARIVVYAPPGYHAALDQRPGAELGIAVMRGVVGREAQTFVLGLSAADPAAFAATECSPGLHTAVWLLEPIIGGTRFSIPVFVDRVAGAEAELGALKLTICIRGPDAPPAPADAPPGLRLSYVDLFLDRVLANPGTVGSYRWRAFVTPFLAGAPAENLPGTYELRSIAPIPQQLTLRARFDARRGVAVLTGRLTVLGRTERGIVVDVYAGPNADSLRPFARIRTMRDGTFSVRRRIARTTTFAAAVPVYYGPCSSPPSTAPLGCVRETTSPVSSPLARVRVRRR